MATAFLAILISQSKAYFLRNWLLAFILFELLKLYSQVHVYRAVRESELYLTGVSLRLRLFSFAVDNACFLWFLYGNVLYYTANEDTEMGLMFSTMFCAILIYGYTYMIKYTVEFVVVCCVMPIWVCISYRYAPVASSPGLSQAQIAVLPRGAADAPMAEDCAICLLSYEIRDQVTYLPCDPRHHFHSRCIEPWLLQYSKCPICNAQITADSIKGCRPYRELVEFVRQKDEEAGLTMVRHEGSESGES